MLLLPELIVVITAFLTLIFDFVFLKARKENLLFIALVGLLLSLGAVVGQMGAEPAEMFGGRYTVDPIGLWFKLIFVSATFLTFLISTEPFKATAQHSLKNFGEFLVVILFTLSGMMFLVSSRDLITLYVSLELATLPLLALTAWSRTSKSGEGALKYLVMAALASAFLLYGFGFLYALTGTTNIDLIAKNLPVTPLLWVVMGLITAGVGFKLTLFPFHFWAPDAYQGAPTPVTAYLSVASKATGLALAFHLFYRIFGSFIPDWQMGIAIVAALTMSLGNLVAILQNDLKRFMAYSSISQAGYIIMGFLSNTSEDATAMMFYMLIYVLTNLAAFGVIILHIHQTGKEDIQSMSGLSQRNPILALAMMIALFGLAGIPPLSGFVGKFFLFSVAAKNGFHWLVFVAAINSTVSLYYYLRIVRQMYIEPGLDGEKSLKVSPLMSGGLIVTTLGSVVCGIIPFFIERIGSDAVRWIHFLSK